MTPFETILVAAIGTGIVGIASFITWFVKLVLPKVIESWDKRNESLTKSTEKMAEAVGKLPEVIKSFEVSIEKLTNKTIDNSAEVQKMRQDLFDRRFKDLQDQINTNALTDKNFHPESRRPVSGPS